MRFARLLCLMALLGLETNLPAGPQEQKSPATPQEAASPNRAAPDRAVLEKQFQALLSGAALVGTYTVSGTQNQAYNQKPRTERYTIAKVLKLQNDLWLFYTRIQFGNNDLTLPLPIRVKWAGDTPVITVTKMLIPGLGTYSARVLIHEGQYAGTWSGGDHGGHLWGKIEKPKDQPREQSQLPD